MSLCGAGTFTKKVGRLLYRLRFLRIFKLKAQNLGTLRSGVRIAISHYRDFLFLKSKFAIKRNSKNLFLLIFENIKRQQKIRSRIKKDIEDLPSEYRSIIQKINHPI